LEKRKAFFCKTRKKKKKKRRKKESHPAWKEEREERTSCRTYQHEGLREVFSPAKRRKESKNTFVVIEIGSGPGGKRRIISIFARYSVEGEKVQECPFKIY